MDEVHMLAVRLVESRDHQRDLVKLALLALGVNPMMERRVFEHWIDVGEPALIDFAPYTAFILRVEAFFVIAHESGLISHDPNSRSDIAYFQERELLRRWVDTWREAGPVLEAIRHREIREADNLQVLASLEGAFNHALRTMPPRESSGLVEMQKWFAKLPR